MKENPFSPETLDQSVCAFVASAIKCTEEVRIAEGSPRPPTGHDLTMPSASKNSHPLSHVIDLKSSLKRASWNCYKRSSPA